MAHRADEAQTRSEFGTYLTPLKNPKERACRWLRLAKFMKRDLAIRLTVRSQGKLCQRSDDGLTMLASYWKEHVNSIGYTMREKFGDIKFDTRVVIAKMAADAAARRDSNLVKLNHAWKDTSNLAPDQLWDRVREDIGTELDSDEGARHTAQLTTRLGPADAASWIASSTSGGQKQ